MTKKVLIESEFPTINGSLIPVGQLICRAQGHHYQFIGERHGLAIFACARCLELTATSYGDWDAAIEHLAQTTKAVADATEGGTQ